MAGCPICTLWFRNVEVEVRQPTQNTDMILDKVSTNTQTQSRLKTKLTTSEFVEASKQHGLWGGGDRWLRGRRRRFEALRQPRKQRLRGHRAGDLCEPLPRDPAHEAKSRFFCEPSNRPRVSLGCLLFFLSFFFGGGGSLGCHLFAGGNPFMLMIRSFLGGFKHQLLGCHVRRAYF